jgi:hypothetical protein
MATSEDLERKARAAARRSWPIRAYRLGEEPDDDLSATTTATERLEMMWPLAVDAWTSSGRPIPDYPRHQTPIRVVRSGERIKGERD